MKMKGMDLRWCGLFATRVRDPVAMLFFSSLVGCVGLDKPQLVTACVSTSAGCTDNPRFDARLDVFAFNPDRRSDLPFADQPGLGHDDASPDRSSTEVSVDRLDAPGLKDAGDRLGEPDVGGTSDLAFDATSPLVEVGPDHIPDRMSVAELPPEIDGELPRERGPEPGPEPPRDGGGPEASAGRSCVIVSGATPPVGTAGHSPAANSKDAFCIATCDVIQGWGCSNFDGRVATVNGTVAACGDALTKKNGYYVFDISAGASPYASIYWWGTYNATCPVPPGGF